MKNLYEIIISFFQGLISQTSFKIFLWSISMTNREYWRWVCEHKKFLMCDKKDWETVNKKELDETLEFEKEIETLNSIK
jgi:hypothetical protein